MPERHSRSEVADQVVHEELFTRLNTVLYTLPAKLQRAFILAQIEQLPYEQVAQIEGTCVGTIKSRVNRARNKIQASLASVLKDDYE